MTTLTELACEFLSNSAEKGNGISEVLKSWNGFYVQYVDGDYNIYLPNGEYMFVTELFDVVTDVLQI